MFTLRMPSKNTVCRYTLSDLHSQNYTHSQALVLSQYNDFDTDASTKLVAKMQ